jgi:hypothetical protein
MAHKTSPVVAAILKWPDSSLDVVIDLALSKEQRTSRGIAIPAKSQDKKCRELARLLNINIKGLKGLTAENRRLH